MKRLGETTGTRRQLFRTVAAVAASVPLVALNMKSGQALGFNPAGGGNGGGGGGGNCCCLLKGTTVSTPSGDCRVEDLRIRDDVDTLSGRRAVKWIGYRKFTKDEGRPWQRGVMPIRVARFAIDDETPHRDLYLSPEHCVFVNNVLIPVKHLVNDVSIVPAMPSGVTAVEYYHVEFDTHEVFRAEGALVESFRDEGTREFFSNFVQFERLYGRKPEAAKATFAPVVGYRNRREKAVGLARSVISNVVDIRDPIQVARDHLARRAAAMLV
jgi:Hint domain